MAITRFNFFWHIVMVERQCADHKAWRRFMSRCRRDGARIERGVIITPHKQVMENIKAWLPRGAKMHVIKVTDYQIEHSERFFGEA